MENLKYRLGLPSFDSSLSGGQSGDGHAEGRAGDVVQANLVAELNAHGIAAVLAADAVVQLSAGGLALGDSHLHQLADAGLVQLGEGIVLIDLGIVVGGQELACIVTGEAEGHLSQVIGAEAEELSFLGDLVGSQAGTGDLNHGTNLVLQISAGSGDLGVSGSHNDILHELHFLHFAGEGDHDLGNQVPIGMSLLHVSLFHLFFLCRHKS